MEVELVRKNDAFHFEALGASHVSVSLDASSAVGGNEKGARPMELLLMGLGGCNAIDVILILKKQRQFIDDLRIKVSGEREKIEGTEMSPFRKINIHYIFSGTLESSKVERAIRLSLEKYCSASAQFAGSAKITSSFEIIIKDKNPQINS